MDFFEKIKKKLFPDKQAGGLSPEKIPLVTEKIRRSQREQSSYFRWQNEGDYRQLLKDTYSAYTRKLNSQESQLKIHLLQSPYANGFALTWQPAIETMHFQHFFDLLKDKSMNLKYNLVIAERRMFDKKNYVETVEKYYLKPPLKHLKEGELIDQLYGNILIEQVLIDNQPSYVKFMASVYSDRLYTRAREFSGLVTHLFEQ